MVHPLSEHLFQGAFKKSLIPVWGICCIGGANGNTVAASLAKGLIHRSCPSPDIVGNKGDGLVVARGDAASAAPAYILVNDNCVALALAGAPWHDGGS